MSNPDGTASSGEQSGTHSSTQPRDKPDLDAMSSIEEYSEAHSSPQLQHKSDPIQQTIPFTNLPAEVRNKIYHLCLVDDRIFIWIMAAKQHSPTKRLLSEDQAYANGAEMQLVHRTDGFPPVKTTVMRRLLYVNRFVHDEAASILYGSHTFQFVRYWKDFICFTMRLTDVSRHHLTKLKMHFPEFRRNITEGKIVIETKDSSAHCLSILKSLPKVETLLFWLTKDLMTKDIGHLQRIHNCRPQKSNITIEFGTATSYSGGNYSSPRRIRVSSGVLEKIRGWGWILMGVFEVVDQYHRFRDEKAWFKALDEEKELDQYHRGWYLPE